MTKREPSDAARLAGAQPVGIRSRDWALGQAVLDEFVVERELGEGGMGKVYLLKSRTTGMCFAVKRAKGLSEGDRRNFLAELQTWIDLPEHANLVPCRFFRTVADEVLIFAEYVEGGSLKDWIDSRKLYEGGEAKALERILDTAIQFAWGLHCVHELGLVHQDVKPANVMMATDAKTAVQGLKARVTDFGLARSRAAGGERYVPELGRSILVSSGGYTPAYCSPEQTAGRKVERHTDVWSWGVSVMEMFQGEVTWLSGSLANEVLEVFLEHNGEEEGVPAMPDGVSEVLRGCFREDPAQRWESLEAVVQKLSDVYQAVVGAEYSRALDRIEPRTASQVRIGERRMRFGESWTDPQKWVERALREEGRDQADVAEIAVRHGSSRQGQLVADLAAYDEARRMYECMIEGGRKDLENDLARLLMDAAFVHETAEDASGALTLFDRAIEIRERLVNVEGRRELANDLASVYQNKAIVVMHVGDNQAAVGLCDRAIEIREQLVNVEGRHELAEDLAILYQNKAIAAKHLGDSHTAAGLLDWAIEIFERLVNVEGRRELANDLASLYQNNGTLVMDLEENQAAVGLYDRAIEILDRLVNVEGRRELANTLAMVYGNKAMAVGRLGDIQAAMDLYDQAIEIRMRLVSVEGRSELADDLASLYLDKADTLSILGDNQTAVALYDQAIEIRLRLVNVEGRRDLSHDLARLYKCKASAVGNLGDYRAAVGLFNQAIVIDERLVDVEGRHELADDLASLYMGKASAVMNLGLSQAAVGLYSRAIEIRERLVNVEGQRELAGDLASVKALWSVALMRSGNTERGEREAREALAELRAENIRTGRMDLMWVINLTAAELEKGNKKDH
jgi:serine/threonine protein kinase/tetratricopeptide (TPR) repeat protein